MDPALIETADFGQQDEAAWRAAVLKALKGQPVDALVSTSADGFRFGPLAARRVDPEHLWKADPETPWTIMARVDDPDPVRAAAQVRDDLMNGATGLAIVFEGAPNAFGYGLPANPEALATVLDGVDLSAIRLRIDPHPASRASAEWLTALAAGRNGNPGGLDLSLGIDPAAVLAGTGRLRQAPMELGATLGPRLAALVAAGSAGALVEADGRVAHNAGATEGQELAVALAAAAWHLRLFDGAGVAATQAAARIGFSLSVSQDLFSSIAKIRALRRLWARVQEICGAEPAEARIHAETSMRMMTARDAETNLLRTTIAAFAAAAGGADTLAVLPYPAAAGLPGAIARRLARNTQLVLMAEAGIGQVADPASGAGGIEDLTDHLCEAAWSEFTAIEREGGVLESLIDGRIGSRVGAAASARAGAFAGSGQMVVGISRYAPPAERPLDVLDAAPRAMPTDGAIFCERFAPRRDENHAGGRQ